MSCVADHGTFFRKGIERVTGDIPRRLDIVLCEEFEQSPHANCPSEETWIGWLSTVSTHLAVAERPTSRDITRRVFASVRSEVVCQKGLAGT